MAMLPKLLEQDRKRAGWSVRSGRVGTRREHREYRELEAGKLSPSWETFDRICKLYGWPQTFAAKAGRR
jgi:Helix-turn-helix domain